jgi:hypothetical protein
MQRIFFSFGTLLVNKSRQKNFARDVNRAISCLFPYVLQRNWYPGQVVVHTLLRY